MHGKGQGGAGRIGHPRESYLWLLHLRILIPRPPSRALTPALRCPPPTRRCREALAQPVARVAPRLRLQRAEAQVGAVQRDGGGGEDGALGVQEGGKRKASSVTRW